MLIAKYSYEEDIRVKQQEAEQLGRIRGRQEGRQEGLILSGRIFQIVKRVPGLTDEQISAEICCEAEEVESARKMFGIRKFALTKHR